MKFEMDIKVNYFAVCYIPDVFGIRIEVIGDSVIKVTMAIVPKCDAVPHSFVAFINNWYFYM